jgi:hypothetical protein
MAKQNNDSKTAQFSGGKAELAIVMSQTPKGFVVRASFKQPEAKRTSGCVETYEDTAKAQAQFDKLCAEALRKGWTPRVQRRSAFTELPAPPAIVAAKGKKS